MYPDLRVVAQPPSSLIPIEVYEILRAPHVLRAQILLLNVGVVVYLWKRKEVFE